MLASAHCSGSVSPVRFDFRTPVDVVVWTGRQFGHKWTATRSERAKRPIKVGKTDTGQGKGKGKGRRADEREREVLSMGPWRTCVSANAVKFRDANVKWYKKRTLAPLGRRSDRFQPTGPPPRSDTFQHTLTLAAQHWKAPRWGSGRLRASMAVVAPFRHCTGRANALLNGERKTLKGNKAPGAHGQYRAALQVDMPARGDLCGH